MNKDAKSDATAWYTPPSEQAPPDAMAWPSPPAESWPLQQQPASPPTTTSEPAQPQPVFEHLSNDSAFLISTEPAAPAPSLGAALAPPTPLVRPGQAPGPDALPPAAPERVPYDPFHHELNPPSLESDDGGRGWHVRESDPTAVAPPPPRPGDPLAEPPPPPIPVMPWDARRKPSPMRRVLLLGMGLFALCGLTALVLTNVNHSGRSIQQPPSVGTLNQVDAPMVAPTLQALDQFERSIGATDVVTGIYGSDSQPQMLLVVVQNPLLAGGGTPGAVQSFERGLTSGAGSAGWVLDPAKATTTSANGTTFICNSGPASGLGDTTLSVCAWTEPGVAGAVIDLSGQPLTDTLNETVLARARSVH